MATSSLEDLLQDALADFEEAPTAPAASRAPQQETGGRSPAPADSGQASSGAPDVPAESVPAAPPKPAPKGLGLGLGGLDRRPRKPAGSIAAAGSSATEGQAANEGDDTGRGGAAAGPVKAACKLPAEAQRLADDLMSLLHEAGLGEVSDQQSPDELTACLADFMGAAGAGTTAGPGAGGAAGLAGLASGSAGPSGPGGSGLGEDDPFAQLFGRILGGMVPPGGEDEAAPPPELAALMQQMMGGGALRAGPAAAEARPPGPAAGPAGTPGTGPSGSGAAAAAAGAADGGDDDALASSRLAGLAQQTLKTVSKQAKKTRGHVEGGSAGRPGGAGAGGAGGLPFGSAAGGGGGLAAMLRELGGLGGLAGGSAGEGGDGAAPAGVGMMVDYIMQHLLSKDVLYGPLKEIRDRYPPWLEAHQGTLPADEYRRYVAQYESVQRVCAHYEAAPSDFAKLMDLIQEMQTYGDPPGDIVEEMTGGAGRDINSILEAAEGESAGPDGPQPALEELSGELDKCKVQ
ncbi:hypothetical protein PLESTB_001050800 [Pleodorina starrii]|uniref:Uncharacterized protein n=1 Tax=Pleodorina starrii TaxID=330485 RepID=A0A9W6BQ74_9CHLO|nr:hypothetical protein PLESTM_001269000 [Pleodorina starrii]GLC55975.1 hypothetical protein PLESTB_001050800 [Pleodorina starrii]GLC63962.1 hypothetical protein PLESTF_000103300 [Pleodorina starrii]